MARIALAFAFCCLTAADWPQWRGPANDGTSPETGVPVSWDGSKNIAWKLPLPGPGCSTPAVWGDHIFLTTTDGDDVALVCATPSGQLAWKRSLGRGAGRYRVDEGNDAAASPSTDGRRAYAFTGTGRLAAFDFAGTEIWSVDCQKRYGKFQIQFGMHSTPVLDGGRLYLALIHSGGAHVIAIDAATGTDIWKVKRPSDGRDECEHSYASPMLWTDGRDKYLVVHGNDYATAHDLADGRELWRVGDLNPKDRYVPTLRFVASPAVSAGLIVVPTAKGGPVVGVDPKARGAVNAGSPGELWRMPKNTPDVPSPLIHDGLVYLCRETGALICLDAKTGAEHYTQRTHTGRYRASPVYADGKIYLTCRDGTVTVVKAGPKFESLATNRLPDQVAATPAIAGGRIYIRGFQSLYAIGGESAAASGGQ